ncbi:hypothetical protein M433DRAFT_446706 [Acidomyces richmondensis BFW]|nr:MAG: hypothetical protein FE78DRAFT_230651 [Acidomyces sp. 'richmondensis']KYG48145.1 hypothetical protein M433DRAFT_446706 [Acidomyces richmondensis BFW]
MPASETTTFGASIVPVAGREQPLQSPPAPDSPALTPAVSREDIVAEYHVTEKPIPPHSPFYEHAPASSERVHARQANKLNVVPSPSFEKDIESGNATPLSPNGDENPFTHKISLDCNKECKMWPSKQTLMEQKQAEKMRKRELRGYAGCGPLRNWWARFDKRQRLIIKIAIAVFVVGVLVAIGVGISKAVNGTYWANNNGDQQQVGSSK